MLASKEKAVKNCRQVVLSKRAADFAYSYKVQAILRLVGFLGSHQKEVLLYLFL